MLNSRIDAEYLDFRRKSDSIRNLVYTPAMLTELIAIPDPLRKKKDSLNAILDIHEQQLAKLWYKEAFYKTNSFLTLEYILFYLEDYNRKREKTVFNKQELWLLFKKLNKRMKKYPTYLSCIKLFNQKLDSIPTINGPFYKK